MEDPARLKQVCTRPVFGLIAACKASVYVFLSLVSCLQSSIFFAIGAPSAAKRSRMSTSVP